jgi:hypothetical protein
MVLDGLRIFEPILANPILVRKAEGSGLIPQWKLYSTTLMLICGYCLTDDD